MKRSVVVAAASTAVFFSLGLGSCAKMAEVDETERVRAPEPGKALVFFVRPTRSARTTRSGNDSNAAIFAGDRFVGFLTPNTHLAAQLAPGDHLFMVVGEKTDFLRAVAQGEAPDFVRAELRSGKIYYIRVEPKSGAAFESRFSMMAINDQVGRSKLANWTGTPQYETNDRSRRWAEENARRIGDLKRHFLPKWEARVARDSSEAGEHTLRAESGR